MINCKLKLEEFFDKEVKRLKELAGKEEALNTELLNFELTSVKNLQEDIADLANKLGENSEGFRKEVQALLNRNREFKIERKLEQIDSAIKRSKFRQQNLTPDKSDNEILTALSSMILGDKSGRAGEGESFDVRRQYHQNKLMSAFRNNFDAAERKILVEPKFQDDMDKVQITLGYMDKTGDVPAEVIQRLNILPKHIELAKKSRTILDMVHKEKIDAGLDLGYRDGYMGNTSVDAEKIALARPEDIKAMYKQSLDIEATFGNLREYTDKKTGKLITVDEQIDSILDGTVERISEKFYKNPTGFDLSKVDTQQRSSLSSRIEQRAAFKWKPEGWVEFRKLYGKKSLGETLISEIGTTSRQVALIETFGKNPAATFNGMKDDLFAFARKNNRSDLLEKLKSDQSGFKGISMTAAFKKATGESNIPVSKGWAQFMNDVKSWTYMATLGRSTITAVNDISSTAATISSATGTSPLSTYADVTKEILGTSMDAFKAVFGNDTNIQEVAQHFGFALEHGLAGINRYIGFDPDAKVSNLTSKIGEYYERFNPIGLQQQFHKNVFGVLLGSSLGKQLKKGSLTEATLKTFKRAGLDERYVPALKAMSKESPFDRYKGIDMFAAQHADDIPDDIIDSLHKELKKDPTFKLNKRLLRDDIKKKTAMLFIENANDAVPTPGMKESLRFTGETRPGTISGEFLRAFTPLKSVAFKMSDVTRRILNASDSKDEKFKQMSAYILMGTGVGYLSLAMKDVQSGKTPRDPMSAETIRESFLIAGAAGILGDMAMQFTEAKSGGEQIKALSGPLIGRGIDAAGFMGQLATGNIPKGKNALRFAEGMTPFGNHLIFKPIVDSMFMEDVRNSLDSKRKRRIRKLQKKRGQRPLFD